MGKIINMGSDGGIDRGVSLSASGIAGGPSLGGSDFDFSKASPAPPPTPVSMSLYLAGRTPAYLYRFFQLSPTAVAVQVGDPSVGWGIGDSGIRGIAYHAGTNVMWACSPDNELMKVNYGTGVATPLAGAVANFGVGETKPAGLTFLGDTMYMLGNSTNALYSVDISDGSATEVADLNETVVRNVGGCAADEDSGRIYIVENNTDTLHYIVLGDEFVTYSSALLNGVNNPQGLAFHDGVLYCLDPQDDRLYTVNLTTGVATIVPGNAGFGAALGGVDVTDSAGLVSAPTTAP